MRCCRRTRIKKEKNDHQSDENLCADDLIAQNVKRGDVIILYNLNEIPPPPHPKKNLLYFLNFLNIYNSIKAHVEIARSHIYYIYRAAVSRSHSCARCKTSLRGVTYASYTVSL